MSSWMFVPWHKTFEKHPPVYSSATQKDSPMIAPDSENNRTN
jgi:hypothetical protein